MTVSSRDIKLVKHDWFILHTVDFIFVCNEVRCRINNFPGFPFPSKHNDTIFESIQHRIQKLRLL